MYKITTPTGETHLTERATWIRTHPSGNAYLICERSKAEGIALHGTPYLFKDGNIVTEVDSFDVIVDEDDKNRAYIEDMFCEIDMMYDERTSSIEDALCELDKEG